MLARGAGRGNIPHRHAAQQLATGWCVAQGGGTTSTDMQQNGSSQQAPSIAPAARLAKQQASAAKTPSRGRRAM